MKKILGFICGVLILGTLTGCGNTTTGADKKITMKKQKVIVQQLNV